MPIKGPIVIFSQPNPGWQYDWELLPRLCDRLKALLNVRLRGCIVPLRCLTGGSYTPFIAGTPCKLTGAKEELVLLLQTHCIPSTSLMLFMGHQS